MKTALIWSLFLGPLLGQEATISGRVINSSKKRIPDAVVTITRPDSGWKRMVLSTKQGYYAIEQLPPGTYRVSAAKPGLSLAADQLVEVRRGQFAAVNLLMTIERASKTATSEDVCGINEHDRSVVTCGASLSKDVRTSEQ